MTRQLLQRLLPILLAFTAGCAPHALSLLTMEEQPSFSDDLSRESLKQAIAQSLDGLRWHEGGRLPGGMEAKTRTAIVAALQRFQDILAQNPSDVDLERSIKQEFHVYQAAGKTDRGGVRRMLITGYYEPIFDARLERTAPFLYPLYGPPGDLTVINDAGPNQLRAGRMENGRLRPYWTRYEIETQGKARGHEIAWLKDPVDVFVLQIQGSGRLRLPDGSVRGIHYAATNGRPYRSIARYLAEHKNIPLNTLSMPRIREYLANHPEERDTILGYNESFIFFHLNDRPGAIGSLGRPLTAGRSVALDAAYYPPGALAYLESRQPLVRKGRVCGWRSLSRFVLAQDSGSAIKGPGRLDLFYGDSAEAEIAAGNMKETGRLFFLFLKKDRPGPHFRPAPTTTVPENYVQRREKRRRG